MRLKNPEKLMIEPNYILRFSSTVVVVDLKVPISVKGPVAGSLVSRDNGWIRGTKMVLLFN